MTKKSLNNIKIPENIDEAIDKGIERIKNEQMVKRNKRKKIVGGIAAAIAIVVTIQLSTPTFAEKLPVFKEIFKFLEKNKSDNSIIYEKNLSEYATNLGISDEDNGIRIVLQEVVYDGQDIYISYQIESETPFPYKTINARDYSSEEEAYEVKDIDKMWLEQKATVVGTGESISSFNHLRGTIIDDNTFVGVVKYQAPIIDGVKNPESFEMNISMEYVSFPRENDHEENLILYEENKFKVEGNWNFDIPIKLDKSREEVIEVNEIKDGFKLEKIIKTPFYIKAKVIPLKEENQKINNSDGGGKELQQHQGYFLTEGNEELKSYSSYFNETNDVAGTMYVTFERSINDSSNDLKLILKDYTILNQSCTEDCKNPETHENSLHPKVIEFDTEIKK